MKLNKDDLYRNMGRKIMPSTDRSEGILYDGI